MHKVENVVSEVTVARGAKLKNYETPEVHLVLPKRKKYSSIIWPAQPAQPAQPLVDVALKMSKSSTVTILTMLLGGL